MLFGGYLLGSALLVDAFKADRFYDAWVRFADYSDTNYASKQSSLDRTSSLCLSSALSSFSATALPLPSCTKA